MQSCQLWFSFVVQNALTISESKTSKELTERKTQEEIRISKHTQREVLSNCKNLSCFCGRINISEQRYVMTAIQTSQTLRTKRAWLGSRGKRTATILYLDSAN
jgi:hypothetical protein